MRILVLPKIPDDQLLRQQWDELVEHMEHPEVFYTYEWAISVQSSYGSVLQPLLVLGYEHERLIGVAALAVKKDGQVSFLAESTADYCDFVSSPGVRREWCEAVFGQLRNFERLSLANLPADSVTASMVCAAAAGRGYRTFIRPAYRCAQVVLGGHEDRAALRCRTTGKKAFRRNLRLLGGNGPVAFSDNVGDEDLDQVVTAFCRAHVTRFMTDGRLSNMIQPERRAFLRALAEQLSKPGWLSMNRLFVGDRCVAWNYGFQFARSSFWYQPTFDPKYERFSPGLCLLAKVIEDACDDPEISVVDLGLGAEGYKERFANDHREILHVSLSSSPIRHGRTVLRHRVGAVIKGRPKAERRIREVVDRLTRLRSYLREKSLGSTVRSLAAGVRDCLIAKRRVQFFQWRGTVVETEGDAVTIRELDADLLGVAVMEYCRDRDTLDYLLCAAQRLRKGLNAGYAAVTGRGTPVCFCWVSDFENFAMRELNQRLRAPTPKAVLIFDCWSPESTGGQDYFASAITALAGRLRSSGNVPWIFATGQDHALLSGIMTAGFSHEFTMHRRRRFFGLLQRVETVHKTVASRAVLSPSL